MPRPKKIKSPEDFGKEFEKLKKPRKKSYPSYAEEFITDCNMNGMYKNKTTFHEEPKKEISPLDELQELEKKLRACTTETPRDIRYKIECNRFILVLQYNSIEVRGDVFYPEMLKGIYIDSRKSELATAQKMLDVLKEWREG